MALASDESMKAAFVIFDRVTFLDFVGFYDAVTRLKSMKIMDDFEWRVAVPAEAMLNSGGAIAIEIDRVYLPGAAIHATRNPGASVFDRLLT